MRTIQPIPCDIRAVMHPDDYEVLPVVMEAVKPEPRPFEVAAENVGHLYQSPTDKSYKEGILNRANEDRYAKFKREYFEGTLSPRRDTDLKHLADNPDIPAMEASKAIDAAYNLHKRMKRLTVAVWSVGIVLSLLTGWAVWYLGGKINKLPTEIVVAAPIRTTSPVKVNPPWMNPPRGPMQTIDARMKSNAKLWGKK